MDEVCDAVFEVRRRHGGVLPTKREVKPLLTKMMKWTEEKRAKILKSSTLGNALNYFVNEELSAFLKDGRFDIDNGWIERAIRKFAIGRNNWLFSDRVNGAKASTLLGGWIQ